MGEAVAVGIEWVKLHGAAVFRVTGATFGGAINAVYQMLRAIPPVLIILATAIFAWLMQRSLALALFVVAGLLLIMNQGYWQQTLETLSLVLVATFAATAIGVPVGIACARRPKLAAASATCTRSDADAAHLRIPDSDAGVVWARCGSSLDFHCHIRAAGAD